MALEGIFYVRAHVSDLARTKRFYGEALGWSLNTDEPGVAGYWFGTGYLVATQDTRAANERTYGGGLNVAVRVDDIEAQHAALSQRGVAVTPIVSRPWGERNFTFTDPDGYLWEYGQPSAAQNG
jgi:catechol 2,3-dioxygenase-like lactoylglutathione lyase family enzyme